MQEPIALLTSVFTAVKRQIARLTLSFLFSAPFMRRRALAILSRHYTKGELVLRYTMADHSLFLNPQDDVITPRVLWRGAWQRRDLERAVGLIATHVPSARGKLFVDIGANIGSETIYAMLTGFFSGGVAIEAEPRNFALLQENLAVNGLESRVAAVCCAVGAKAGKLRLRKTTWNLGGHAIASAADAETGSDTITVDAATLPEILATAGSRENDPGLVWIDVNGSELQVLEGMGDMLSRRVPIVIEHLPALISADVALAVYRLLSKHYTRYCRIDTEHAEPAPIERMNPLADSGDFLFF